MTGQFGQMRCLCKTNQKWDFHRSYPRTELQYVWICYIKAFQKLKRPRSALNLACMTLQKTQHCPALTLKASNTLYTLSPQFIDPRF